MCCLDAYLLSLFDIRCRYQNFLASSGSSVYLYLAPILQLKYFIYYARTILQHLNSLLLQLRTANHQMNNALMNSMKDIKAQVSIESLKTVVKKFKDKGFKQLTHHDLAVALSTVGFSQVCKQFGAVWNAQCEKQAQKILANSDYELNWYGKTNNIKYSNFLPLCVRGDIEKVKQFMSTLNKEAKKQLHTTVDNLKRNALHLSAKQGYDILTDYLIKQQFPLNARDRQLKTPLHYTRDQRTCQVLINNNAKVVVKDNKMCTPVHYTASGADYKCLQIQLKAANVVNQKDATGKTALFYAVYNNSEQLVNIIRVLIQNGAKVNEQDIYGRTPLHYAAQAGKSRCIPILLRNGASVDIRDKHGKSPLDLAELQQKIRKMILAYCNNKGVIFEDEENSKRKEFKDILDANNIKQGKQEEQQKSKDSKLLKQSTIRSKIQQPKGQSQLVTKQVNQISTWVRQKFFVLMKKLQQSGVKAMWHLKRPYVYTGSWAEDVQSLQDLYQTFLNINGPEAAMRTFNILCPYQKSLPAVINKSEQAFQSFFGESWFSNDPVEKLRNLHSSSKVRTELQMKYKEAQDLKTELLGYKSQIQTLESKIMNYNEQISYYKRVEEDLKKQKNKNTQQYTQILKLMSQNEELRTQLGNLTGDQEKTKILSNLVAELRSKNEDLEKQIETMKIVEAASRRKCGQIFLKSISLAQNSSEIGVPSQQNLYDDDAIISLYNLLKSNPPNLQKRFKNADKRGNNKLTIDQFTLMLQNLSMLPQDVMSMHRITGFAFGRKTLSLQQFKTILENRHKNRPMWEKKLIRKIKSIILENGMKLEKFFQVMDKDGNGTIEATELRKGLQFYNIFMNQNDWSNLFNLLDSDNSGQIDLNQLKTLMEQQKTGKLEEYKKQEVEGEGGQQSQINKQQISGQDQKQIQQEQQKQNKQNDKQNRKQQKQEQGQKQKQQKEQQNQEQKEEQKKQQQEQFDEPYEEKEEEQEGKIQLNGRLKVQVPAIKIDEHQKVYIKFFVNEDVSSDDQVKLADLSKKKLEIAAQIKFIQYKILDLGNLTLTVSVWATREMDEENYLGEVRIGLREAIDKPNEWAIKDKFKLVGEEYEKDVQGKIIIQAKWSPQQE